jgi:N-acetylneuraminic acid mutarotase
VGTLTAVVAAAVLALSVCSASAWASPLFSRLPAEMAEPRYAPVAALLPDGNLLVAGGYVKSGVTLKSAEVFNPASGTFQKLTGEMVEPRGETASAVLPSGKVLIAGGEAFNGTAHPRKTAELFDPATNTFAKLPGEMSTARDGLVAAPLPGGKVLIAGGEVATGKPLKTAELFDPATNTFEKLPAEAIVGRYMPAVAALPDGKVLIAGGGGEGFATLKSAELFNPETDTFEALSGATHELTESREEVAGVLLQNGHVLILGGFGSVTPKGLKTAELFDPETNTFELLSSELTEARDGPAAVLLSDGRALILGGYNPLEVAGPYLKSAELTSVAPPTAATAAASGVGATTAKLNGTALTEASANAYFQYGTSTAYGASTAPQTVAETITPRPISATIAGLAPGTTYHFRIVVENAGGPSYGADQTFTTAPAPKPPVAIASVPPTVTNASETNAVWRRGNRLAQIGRRKPPVGTTFSFALNEQASVSFTFTQQAGGRRVKGKCVAQTKANRRKHSCKRTLTRGTLTFSGRPGTNKVAFQGRISRSNKLRLGAYTLTITASNAAGQRSSPKWLTFTIVK